MSGLVLWLPRPPTRKVWVGGTCGACCSIDSKDCNLTPHCWMRSGLQITCSFDQGSTVLTGIGCLYPMGVAKNLALIFIELHSMLSIWALVFPDQFITTTSHPCSQLTVNPHIQLASQSIAIPHNHARQLTFRSNSVALAVPAVVLTAKTATSLLTAGCAQDFK